MKLVSAVKFVMEEGDMVERGITGRYFPNIIEKLGLADEVHRARQQYISFIQELKHTSITGGLPFELVGEHPPSVFYTAQVVSNLMDMSVNTGLQEKLVGWLEEVQEDGMWSDDRSLADFNPPSWQDPTNRSVHIFNTAVVASILARWYGKTTPLLSDAVSQLDQLANNDGALFGFPQSTWVVTPALSVVHGLDSKRFNLHLGILEQFMQQDMALSDLLTLGRGLVEAELEPGRPLLTECLDRVEQVSSDNGSRWADRHGEISATTTLSALLLLKYGRRL